MGISLFKPSPDRYPQSTPTVVNVTVAPPPNPRLPNPDPSNYEILENWWSGHGGNQDHYLVVKIRYPDCTNYEGTKILVYRRVYMEELIRQKLIDPHFSDKTEWTSPIARFEPTQQGWEMAMRFCRMMLKKE